MRFTVKETRIEGGRRLLMFTFPPSEVPAEPIEDRQVSSSNDTSGVSSQDAEKKELEE